jgi:hypothetical protein
MSALNCSVILSAPVAFDFLLLLRFFTGSLEPVFSCGAALRRASLLGTMP